MVKTSPSTTGDVGSIPGWEPRSHMHCGQKKQNIKQKQYCNKFNKDFKNCPHQKMKIKNKPTKNPLSNPDGRVLAAAAAAKSL